MYATIPMSLINLFIKASNAREERDHHFEQWVTAAIDGLNLHFLQLLPEKLE